MTEFALSADQLDFFDRNGYLVIRELIPPDLIDRLRRDTAAWIESAPAEGTPDFDFARDVLFRINYVHHKDGRASLELLGCPPLLGVAESLMGPNFVPTYESLVFKGEGDGAPVYWHQDAVHPRTSRIANIDVYLDASEPGGGALRVVPGSHRSGADLCRLEREQGWDIPGSIEVAMQPGDVLVHDVMIVHGSPPVAGNRLRRTLYYEFRPAEQILAEGPWDEEWIARRMRLIPLAQAAHAQAFPEATAFDWNPDQRWRPDPARDVAEELRVVHLTHTPGNYCSAGDVVVSRQSRPESQHA